jgi:excisionase family DNA binding protein
MIEQRGEHWLMTSEAADYLRVHQETVCYGARDGEIPAVKLGNRGGFRFRRVDLDRFLQDRTLGDDAR